MSAFNSALLKKCMTHVIITRFDFHCSQMRAKDSWWAAISITNPLNVTLLVPFEATKLQIFFDRNTRLHAHQSKWLYSSFGFSEANLTQVRVTPCAHIYTTMFPSPEEAVGSWVMAGIWLRGCVFFYPLKSNSKFKTMWGGADEDESTWEVGGNTGPRFGEPFCPFSFCHFSFLLYFFLYLLLK